MYIPILTNSGQVHFQFGIFFIFIQILKESSSVSKKWRIWSDTTFCGVWSGIALFAVVQQKGC